MAAPPWKWVILFIINICLTIDLTLTKDVFHEELFIKPLPSGHVFSYFQFTTVWESDIWNDPYRHCHLFPRALGEILTRYNVQELHISLTEGLWRHESWGYPVYDAPPGAEVWVWFSNGTENIDAKWKELTSSLSGLLCASLNFIDTTNSMSPEFSFRPAGVVGEEPVDSSLLRYGTLPQEIVCTENLTPWKKLLPCDSKKGLGTLLNAGFIHNTNYHSLGIHLRNVCRNKACNELSIELRQTVSLVYDLVILEASSPDFSIKKLFGSGLPGACPLAEDSKVYIDITSNSVTPFELSPQPTETLNSGRGGYKTQVAVYDVKNFDKMFNIAISYKKNRLPRSKIPPLLTANRFISGYGQQKGGIITKVHNRHWKPINIVVLENIPWFVPVYLHTLKVVSNGIEITPDVVKYVPGKQRIQPTHLEMILKLPPRAVTEISIEMDFVFLKWQEYPPDASHGFYVGSSVITSLLPLAKNYTGVPQDESFYYASFNASRDGYLVQLRTESLIIALPTPDFSMPYNVICLACTVVALAFGPIHNITTKRLKVRKVKKSQGLIPMLLGKVTSCLAIAFRRAPDQQNKEKEE